MLRPQYADNCLKASIRAAVGVPNFSEYVSRVFREGRKFRISFVLFEPYLFPNFLLVKRSCYTKLVIKFCKRGGRFTTRYQIFSLFVNIQDIFLQLTDIRINPWPLFRTAAQVNLFVRQAPYLSTELVAASRTEVLV